LSEQIDVSLRLEQRPFRAAAAAACRKVLVIGLFPPPIDGQRIITQRMFEQIDQATTAARLDLDRFPRLGWLSKPVSAIAAALLLPLARLSGYSAVYLAPHSGAGLLFSCFLAFASRCCGYGLFVHYHSYRNIGRRSRLMAAFLRLCGPEAVHIVLAPPMARGLQHYYPLVQHVAVVSNSVFVPPRRVPRNFADRPIRIGHLSNLSREKGIEIVLACMRRLARQGLAVELHLAGPATDETTETLVKGAVAEFGDRLHYRGPLARSEVHRFYEDIDVFLFPTQHEHEAEPLVIIDAMSAGVPVLATNRGCIDYILGSSGGRSVDTGDFVDCAAAQIGCWARDLGALASASAGAQRRFAELHAASRDHLDALLTNIVGPAQHR
jgi:glycosyltransferase involved in cell wall biosynthesis